MDKNHDTNVNNVHSAQRWSAASGARDPHPREEHLIPLHVVVGASKGVNTLEDYVMGVVESDYSFG